MRLAPLDGVPAAQQAEQWIYRPARGGGERRFDVVVDVGKPFDVLGLKGAGLAEIRAYDASLRKMARRLYDDAAPRRTLHRCPACDAETGAASEALRVFGVPYHRCQACGHVFVLSQPAQAALDAVFAHSADHSSAYVDAATAERRITEIIMPKIAWTLAAYERQHGRRPARAIDVGAGGGHFVAGLQRSGIAGEGYELSAASRAFAAKTFGIALRAEDFLAAPAEPRDLMTFWGLLEYTPQPRRFLEAARRHLDPVSGLLVVEVPRANAISTAAQSIDGAVVARHMDPTSHVNCFTDSSLATALVECGFAPVAAWYFGMDAYELVIQSALRADDADLVARLADMIPAVQQSLDQGRQCDDLVMAAVPVD